ncbi:MAG: hypothetical protein LBK99_20555 [Opitutaceae bacterium]|nr:hypothetical protein [Opitutaceae bacterium]
MFSRLPVKILWYPACLARVRVAVACALLLPLFALSAGASDFSWMDGMSAASSDSVASPFRGRDPASGALWEWKTAPAGTTGGQAFASVHPPWKKQSGVVFADFPVSLPAARTLAFVGEAAVGAKGGDGVGISLLVNNTNTDGASGAGGAGGTWHFVGNLHVAPGGETHAIHADLSKWVGRKIMLRLLVDPEKSTSADTARLSRLRVLADGKEIRSIEKQDTDGRTAWISSSALSDLELWKTRPEDASIMTRHLEGRQRGVNLYSRQDSYRPMIGAHVYLTPEALRYVPFLNDLFDFAAHDKGEAGNALFEKNGIPWIRVIHNAIPLGQWDEKRRKRLADACKPLPEYPRRFRFNLGVTSGSEPHINPNFSYTGHTREEVEAMTNTPASSREFGVWLAGLYNDKSPSEDTNGDGITFRSDFGFDAPSWDAAGLAMPETGEDAGFLKTLYREHVIAETIAAVDRVFDESGLVVTSRLLSRQYPPAFAQSVRQLRIPSQGAGVTYYNYRGMTLDPEATQARFARERVFESEKTGKSVLSIRPPFRNAEGACIGVFGPYRGYDRFEAALKAGFDKADQSPLLVTVEQIQTNDPLERRAQRQKTFKVAAGETIPAAALDLERSPRDWYLRITCRAERHGSASTSVYVEPWLLAGADRKHDVCGDYYAATLWHVLDTRPDKPIDMGHAKTNYNPAVTEFRGSYIYQQGLLNGRRPVYNEFQTGNADGNTAANLYRGVFHELQYKPAVINWFCYGGGSPYARFAWMDIHYMATELAVLRGQLELMRPYPEINRTKRPLAVFLPPAAPEPVGKHYAHKDPALAVPLEPFGPDVFLSDQTDKYGEYRNIVIYPGYTDGKTDRFLSDFLRNIPRDREKKVLVLCAGDRLYTDPGARSSKDFRQSLREVLPVSPAGGEIRKETVAIKSMLSMDIDLPANFFKNPAFAGSGQWIQHDKSTVGWRGGNLMVLAGNPVSGLDKLITDFFGLAPPALREAGKLKILNRDTTATEAGWYCLAEGQTLTLADGLTGYDLVNRKPVAGKITGETVVSVFSRTAFEALDAGTARVELVSREPGRITLHARPPEYPFEGDAKPELVFYSAKISPAVTCDGAKLEPQPIPSAPAGYWRVPVSQPGNYVINARN